MDMRWKDACRCSSDGKVFLRGEMLYGVHSYWWLCISFSVNLPLVVSSVSWETSIRNAILISYLLYRSMYYAETHIDLQIQEISHWRTHRQQQAVDACNKAPILVTDNEIFEEYSANDLPRSCRCARCILKSVLGANEIPCWTKKVLWLCIDLMFFQQHKLSENLKIYWTS